MMKGTDRRRYVTEDDVLFSCLYGFILALSICEKRVGGLLHVWVSKMWNKVSQFDIYLLGFILVMLFLLMCSSHHLFSFDEVGQYENRRFTTWNLAACLGLHGTRCTFIGRIPVRSTTLVTLISSLESRGTWWYISAWWKYMRGLFSVL